MTKKTKKGHAGLIILLVLLLVLAGVGVFGYTYYTKRIKAVTSESHPVVFTVEEGENMDMIIEKLYKEGLVQDKLVTKIFVKLNHVNNYYHGDFVLDKNMSLATIFGVLGDPAKAQRDQVAVTIAPGYWAKDAAKAIADATNLSADELFAAWNDPAYVDSLVKKYEVLTEDIYNSEHCYLEGYITPETYNFYAETTVEQVTERLLDYTESIYKKYADQIAKSDFNTHEIYTLASVILFEANSEEDMKLVSSVFYNRFAKGMKMQSSVTVCYALYNYDSWTECESHTDINSAYNTYMYDGLPVGPVCNPTETALKAALNPAESNYYYFIANLDTGECIFAETYQEHVQNIRKYLNY